jgi:hypothetical protein
MQHEFPYRFVFPANHPYSTYTQFLSRPPVAQNYDIYPHQSHTHQNSYPPPQEYKYVLKQHQQPQQTAYQASAQSPFSSNSLPVSPPVPLHSQPSPAPLILLVHTGPSGNGANGPFQTFVLIPADSSSNQHHHQHVNNLAAAFAGGGVPNLQMTQLPPSQPYGNVAALPPSPNVMPITQVPPIVLFRPSHHTKNGGGGGSNNNNNNNHLHGLLQRPISVYPMPNHKYYPHKKKSVESRMSEKESGKKQTTSTEASESE